MNTRLTQCLTAGIHNQLRKFIIVNVTVKAENRANIAIAAKASYKFAVPFRQVRMSSTVSTSQCSTETNDTVAETSASGNISTSAADMATCSNDVKQGDGNSDVKPTLATVTAADNGDDKQPRSVELAAESSDIQRGVNADKSDLEKSKRYKRSRRRGRLHKRQLNDAEGEGKDEAENTEDKQNKKQKTEEAEMDVYKETDYYIENGLRKVYPYTYTYLCYCKLRWQGSSIIDVLSAEFISETPEFHAAQIERGLVKVNGKPTRPDRILRGKNELISNCVHRHELPVTADPIKILANTEDYVVIDKPSSIPVHPCGRYRHNTITFLLGREHKLLNLRTIYRLDRLTSGLLIFGKNHEATNRIMDAIKARDVSKTYLCRVVGKFPDGIIECKQPMDKVHDKIGTWRVKEGGKESHTSFERVSYNGDTSVVKCMPHTGRTHQIRVHIQYVGHPIVNDPLYNDFVWGPEKGKGGVYGKSDEQLYQDLLARHTQNMYETEVLEEVPEDSTQALSEMSSHDLRLTPDPNCNFCKKKYRDPTPDKLVMYLHALNYKGPGWEYSTDIPEWANEDWSPIANT